MATLIFLKFLHNVQGDSREKKIRDPAGRLTHLIKFNNGKAKNLIKHCIHLTPNIGYNTAITLMN